MSITTNQTLNAGTWEVDPVHSSVGFTVRHLGMSKVRGRFNSFQGTAEIADEDAVGSVVVTVDMDSVDTNNADRDGHLRNSDFFGVEEHQQMSFRSTSVSKDALVGIINIKGVTRPVEFDLEFFGVTVDHYGTTRTGFSARGQINRSDFGIDFNAPFGLDGILLSDNVDIELEVQLVPQA